jgi:twinkle protein
MDRTKSINNAAAVKANLNCWCGDSSRGCAYYTEAVPHLNCFKCGEQSYDKEIIEEVLELNNITTEGKDYAAEVKAKPVTRGVFNELQDRSISKGAATRYGVETLFNGTQPYARSFQFKDDKGGIVAAKVKTPDKKMFWEGDVSKAGLFGQHLSPSGGKFLTITEGEEDALAVYQMLKESDERFEPAVVSIKNGASSAVKECQANWEYINSFENIIIAFDGDEPGRKAAAEVSRLFKYRPKILTFHECKETEKGWEYKDGNDYLKNGRNKDFVRMWWAADQLRPKGILSLKSLWGDMVSKDNTTMVETPWAGLNKLIRGFVTSHMYVLKAPPKIGKTEILHEIIEHINKTTQEKCGLFLLENTKKETGIKICAKRMNKLLSPWELPDDLSELKKTHDEVSEGDRIMIFDPEGDRTAENILEKMTYFVKAYGIRYLFLDHITMLAYNAEDENERRFLDKLCANLKSLAVSLDVCLIVVTHVNDDGKTRGSRASLQLCDAMFSLERDKLSENPIVKNTTHFIVEDNRWGECGKACSLMYNKETGRLTEFDFDGALEPDAKSERVVNFGDDDNLLPF